MVGDLGRTADTVIAMVTRALDALVSLDGALARAVRRSDDGVDAAHRQLCAVVPELIPGASAQGCTGWNPRSGAPARDYLARENIAHNAHLERTVLVDLYETEHGALYVGWLRHHGNRAAGPG